MQIVIDIPEKVKQTFDNAKNEDLYGNYYDYNSLVGKAIQNGISIPKGHGRLVDANEIDNNIYDLTRNMDLNYGQISEVVDNASTIIEADRSEES